MSPLFSNSIVLHRSVVDPRRSQAPKKLPSAKDGINRPWLSRRTAPRAMNASQVTLHVADPGRLDRYGPVSHRLQPALPPSCASGSTRLL